VTGQVARIDRRAGTAAIVNAGHPLPLRLRDGRVEPVRLAADPPFGTVPGHQDRVQRLPLEPGDRLMFFTDGILERNTTGVDIEAMVAAGAGMHPREAVQHLVQAILKATGGALNDDATALCLDWHGGPMRERTTDSGANPRRGPGVDKLRPPGAVQARGDRAGDPWLVVAEAQKRANQGG
jgi:hypothetical protein